MNLHHGPYPAVQMLIDTVGDWLKHRRELNEIRRLDRTDFDRIANDLRVSPEDLEELIQHGRHAADELPQMLHEVGIDEEQLGRNHPLLLRDMERVCALCRDKARCHRDLAACTAPEHYHDYCLNAAALDSLEHTAH